MTVRSQDEVAPHEGQIGLTLRIGVTGHRHLEDENRLARRIHRELERLPKLLGLHGSASTPFNYVVVSALADGADRLVVREVMKCPGSRLEAVLPFPPDEYLPDFDAESKEDFNALLSLASSVRALPAAPEREASYERAGRSIVDGSDVLIALWDGAASRGRGGTAEIVEYARQRGVPRIVISTLDDDKTVETLSPEEAESQKGAHLSPEAFEKLDRYNAERIDSARFSGELAEQLADLQPRGQAAQNGGLPVKALADWVLPYFVRADLLARRHQHEDECYGVVLFSLAAVAVMAVALQTLFFPEVPHIVLVELIALLVIGGLLLTRRPLHAHEHWITYRYLAEQLRSAFFLVMAGVQPPGSRTRSRLPPDAPDEDRMDEDPSEEWIRRALEEVSARRPQLDGATACGDVADYLANHWIDHQAKYYRRAAKSHRRKHERLTTGIWALLLVSIVVAAMHYAGVGEGEHGEEAFVGNLLVFLSISVPACAAALGGVRELRDHRRHAERYGRAARVLAARTARMRAATNQAVVATVASEAARVMREEGSDWFGVVRFEELDAL